MLIALTWLRLDLRRRWRALVVLALLVAIATTAVLTAVAGARRGQSAFDRLWAQTLPATVTVLPNQQGFDWAKVGKLPEVAAMGLFVVYYGISVEGFPRASPMFPFANDALERTVERPVVLSGRLANPGRLDEVDVTVNFLASSGKHIGDTLTLRLSSVAQTNAGIDSTNGEPMLGPRLRVRIVGVARTPFTLDNYGDSGAVYLPFGLFTRYRDEILGTNKQRQNFINAVIRLRGGEAAIPAFRADLARVTGRSDIDVWDNYALFGDSVKRMTAYEAVCLLAFALAALLAAFFLIGQAVARLVSAGMPELQVLQSLGLTRWQAVAAAVGGPLLAALAGGGGGMGGAVFASRWMPLGFGSLAEPHLGTDADWLVLGSGWAVAVALVGLGAAGLTWRGLATPRGLTAVRQSVAAVTAARAGLPVPAVVGARFALDRGHGRAALPVRPAIFGAVAGVLGVVAAFTFSAGVSDATTHPERFGQTYQLIGYFGLSGRDYGPVARVAPAVAADRDVTGFLDVLIGSAQSGRESVESFSYSPVAGKQVPVVLTAGRIPASASEVVLAAGTAQDLGAGVGSTIRLGGGTGPAPTVTVTGIGFVPSGPHNDYAHGAWLTPGGYDRVFRGAHYRFKFHVGLVSVRPGADPLTVARHLNAAAVAVPGGQGLAFTPPDPLAASQRIKDVSVLPQALGAFLALLAVGAVGYALATAVSRRRHELAVLRVLGLTRVQARLVVVVQAGVLACCGLVLGIPLGVAAGRALWRAVAAFAPLDYQPPAAGWALTLVAPVTLVVALLLGALPGERAARLRPAAVLRAE